MIKVCMMSFIDINESIQGSSGIIPTMKKGKLQVTVMDREVLSFGGYKSFFSHMQTLGGEEDF